MSFLSFPLRLREGGTLRRIEESSAVLSFLHIMAITPGGSWTACPNFGFRDLLESGRQYADSPRMAMERANLALKDLGIVGFRVQEIVRENSERSDFDIYSIILVSTKSSETYSTRISAESV
jgi:hypothetical protein